MNGHVQGAQPSVGGRLGTTATWLLLLVGAVFWLSPCPAQEPPAQADAKTAPEPVAVPAAAEADKPAAPTTDAAAAEGAGLAAAVPAADAPRVALPKVRFIDVKVGDFVVRNGIRSEALLRKQFRADDLWAWYMHGVADHYATPVPWAELFFVDESPDQWMDSEAAMDTPYKSSNLPAIRLGPGSEVTPGKPLPVDLAPLRGRTLRIFVWVKGESTGKVDDCWSGPPGMDLMIKAGGNGVLLEADAPMRTQGTFPWHGYYRDVVVPDVLPAAAAATPPPEGAAAEAAPVGGPGLYVRLYNRYAGTAWFSTLSWEEVKPESRYLPVEMQDPVTGSFAFNPVYDELPYHFRWGRGIRHKWQFVLGADAGLVGQPYNITTKAGLQRYYMEKGRRDRQHMSMAVRCFADWYHFGLKFGLLPAMEEGWLETLSALVLKDQNLETGFWGVVGQPRSMAITYDILDGLFGNCRIPRPDHDDTPTPWMSMGVARIPGALNILRTVCSLQGAYLTEQGRREPATWALDAYDYTDKPLDRRSPVCSLAATSNALYLLRVCAPYAPRDQQGRYYATVKQAFRYVLEHCVTDDGLWKQTETDAHVTSGAFMPRIVESSGWLERRITAAIARPQVKATAVKGGAVTLAWEQPAEECVSVRVYAAPTGTSPDALNETHLVGVLQKGGETIEEMDPFVAVQVMRDASRKRWNLRWDVLGSQTYTEWKLRQVRRPLPASVMGASLALRPADLWPRPVAPEPAAESAKSASAADKPVADAPAAEPPAKEADAKPAVPPEDPLSALTVFVSAATWYGEESRPVPLVIAVTEPPPPPAGGESKPVVDTAPPVAPAAAPAAAPAQ